MENQQLDIEQNEDRISNKDPNQTISVTGRGRAEAPSDQRIVSVAVVAEGDDPSAVRDDLRRGAGALREALTSANIPEDQVKTTQFQIFEPFRSPFQDPDPEEPAYRGIHNFEVTIDDMDQTGSVLDSAANAQAQIQSVTSRLSNSKRTELRNEALANATRDAHQQSEILAATSELEITGVQRVGANDFGFNDFEFNRMFAEEMFEDDGETGTIFEPSNVTVSATVDVIYFQQSK